MKTTTGSVFGGAAYAVQLSLVAGLLLTGCTYPNRSAKLDARELPYRVTNVKSPSVSLPDAPQEPGDPDGKTLVIMTASGGGTRAAAFTLGTLKLLDRLCVKGAASACQHDALDYVDVISSVSGSSVPAAHFAAFGRDGFNDLEHHLLDNGFWDIFWHFVEPGSLFGGWFPHRSQIDVMVNRLKEDDEFLAHPFAEKTFAELNARPRLVLNATDMGEGAPFSFTPENFKLLCADLSQFSLAEAVAASAAFPYAFGPLVIRNHAYNSGIATPDKQANVCPQHHAAENDLTSPIVDPDWVKRAIDQGMNGLLSDRSEFRRAERARSYYTPDCTMDGSSNQERQHCKEWIHLLDGGVADNLGISEPLWMLTNVHATEDPGRSYASRIFRGDIKRVVFIVVNVRGDPPSHVEETGSPQGFVGQTLAITGGPIDATSDLLLDKLAEQLAGGLSKEVCEYLELAAAGRVPAPDVKIMAGQSCDSKADDREDVRFLRDRVRALAKRTYYVPLDFDLIGREKPGTPENPAFAKVRRYFQAIPTTWWLDFQEIKDLQILPACLLQQSEEVERLIADLAADNVTDDPAALKQNIRDACTVEIGGQKKTGYEIFEGHKASTGSPF